MVVLAGRQRLVSDELSQWREHVADGVGSRIALLKVPLAWGRSSVLDWLAKTVSAADGGPVTFLFRIGGKQLPEGRGPQALAVRALLADAGARHPVARTFGLDRPVGIAVLGQGVGSLFVSGFGALVGMLAAQEAVTAAGNLRDVSQAGQVGALARAARSASQVSAQVPVVVLIDDADCLDLDMALALLESLTFRDDGMMLVVVAASPDGALAKALGKGDRVSLAGRVFTADADPDMGPPARTDLVRELCPRLDDGLARRIGQRTATFAEVFAVTTTGPIARLRPSGDPAGTAAVVDAVIDAVLRRPEPSAAAALVWWAGGVVHARQLERALAVTGQAAPAADRDLERSGFSEGSIVRLVDPTSSRFEAPAAALADRARAIAAAVVEEALAIGADSAEPLVGRIVAGRAGHRVRGYITGRDLSGLLRVQRDLVAALEAVGDLPEAAEVAAEALERCPPGGIYSRDRDELAAAVLRVAGAVPSPDLDPIVQELVEEAVARGAAIGLEARVWAAASLLAVPGRREDGSMLAEQAAADLDNFAGLGLQAVTWRLQLAVQCGRAGRLDIMQRLLAPLLSDVNDDLRDLAMRVLHAADDPHADIRLRIALLEAGLQTQPSDDDLLRLHHALADARARLGEYPYALHHVKHELPLRISLQGPEHPDTLTARGNLAWWTGEAGDPAAARDLFAALLPVRERVLGPEHPETLAARGNLAWWTGQAGDPAAARDLFAALLPVVERVLGPEHPDTLLARANLAWSTGHAGDPAAARDLYAELLPVRERVSGPEHPETLTARANLAWWTGQAEGST
jgi:hypothetical protein